MTTPALAEAKASRQMLIDFKTAVERASYPGDYAVNIAQGLMFLSSMLQQADLQIQQISANEIKAKHEVKAAVDAQAQQPSAPVTLAVVEPTEAQPA